MLGTCGQDTAAVTLRPRRGGGEPPKVVSSRGRTVPGDGSRPPSSDGQIGKPHRPSRPPPGLEPPLARPELRAARVPSPAAGHRPNGRVPPRRPQWGEPGLAVPADTGLTAGAGRRGLGARELEEAPGGGRGRRREEGARAAVWRDARAARSAPQNQQDFQNGGSGRRAGMRRPIRAASWELAGAGRGAGPGRGRGGSPDRGRRGASGDSRAGAGGSGVRREVCAEGRLGGECGAAGR